MVVGDYVWQDNVGNSTYGKIIGYYANGRIKAIVKSPNESCRVTGIQRWNPPAEKCSVDDIPVEVVSMIENAESNFLP